MDKIKYRVCIYNGNYDFNRNCYNLCMTRVYTCNCNYYEQNLNIAIIRNIFTSRVYLIYYCTILNDVHNY